MAARNDANAFWKQQRDSGISVDNEKIKVVDVKGKTGISTYSNTSINTKVHADDIIKWSVMVNKTSKPALIALVNTCKHVNDNFLKQRDIIYYGIGCRTGNKTKNDSHGFVDWTKFGDKKFQNNTLMTIELNIPETTISIYHNNEFVGVAFENVVTNNVDYYLGVVMWGVNDEMIFEKMEIIPTPADTVRDRVFKKFNDFASGLIECNKVKTVIGSDDIVNLSLELLNIARKMANHDDNDQKEIGNEHINIAIETIGQNLIEWLFPKPHSLNCNPVTSQEQSLQSLKQLNSENNLTLSLHEIKKWINCTKNIEKQGDIDEFVKNYHNILEQLLIQKNRIKKTSHKIKITLKTKSNHNRHIKELEKQLNEQTKQNLNFAQKAKISLEKITEIKKEVERSLQKYQELMTTHKKCCENRNAKQSEINKTQEKLDLERSGFNQCETLLKQYRVFKQDTKKVDQAMNRRFDTKFDEFESKWFEWDEKEVLFWFKYKLNWFQTSINSEEKNNDKNDNEMKEDSKEQEVENEVLSIDFDKILVNLESRRACGKFISVLDTADLNNLGFELMKHQLIIYNAIQSLIVKYPIPTNIIDDGIEGQVMHEPSETTDDKEIDEKYLCPLSKQLMKDPVIASDGVTYERSALEEYLRRHHKLPDDDMIIDDIDQEMQNLFVDDDLKDEIDKMLQ